MKSKRVRSRVLAGCLLTMLLPASSSLFAKSTSPSTFELCPAKRSRLGTITFGAPRELFPASAGAPVNAAAPWFRGTAVLLRDDRICLVPAPVEGPARAARPAAEVKPPGVVGNLRRTDSH